MANGDFFQSLSFGQPIKDSIRDQAEGIMRFNHHDLD